MRIATTTTTSSAKTSSTSKISSTTAKTSSTSTKTSSAVQATGTGHVFAHYMVRKIELSISQASLIALYS